MSRLAVFIPRWSGFIMNDLIYPVFFNGLIKSFICVFISCSELNLGKGLKVSNGIKCFIRAGYWWLIDWFYWVYGFHVDVKHSPLNPAKNGTRKDFKLKKNKWFSKILWNILANWRLLTNTQENIKFAGIEIKYNTAPGSVGIAVHSESQDRNFVSRVPLWAGDSEVSEIYYLA